MAEWDEFPKIGETEAHSTAQYFAFSHTSYISDKLVT